MIGILYIVGAVQAFFFAVLIACKKNKNKADPFLLVFFLIFMLSLLFAYSNTFEFYKSFPQMMPIIALVPLLYGPILYLYVYGLHAAQIEIKKFWVHLIPIFIFYLVMFPIFLDKGELLRSFTERFIEFPLYFNVGICILYLSAPVYFVFILLLLHKHKKNIKDAYSYHEKVNLKWLTTMVVGAIFLWMLEFGRIVYTNYLSHTIPVTFSHLIKSSYAIFIFVMGFYGLRQGNIFTDVETVGINKAKIDLSKQFKKQPKKRCSHLDSNGETYKRCLIKYLDEEKPYLKSDLKLLDIAIELDIPPHVLSTVINEKLNKNFFNLINSYRVTHAKEMLSDDQYAQTTILSIAYDCGFNSKSSFNRIFKNQTSLTPSMFQKRMLSKKQSS